MTCLDTICIEWPVQLHSATAALQVTVIFLVDVDKCVPNKNDWPRLWGEQQAWKQAKKDHEDEQVRLLPSHCGGPAETIFGSC